MTDCPNAEMRDRLPDLLHERLDASARAAVMAHVAECADCRTELALLREARVALSTGVRNVDVAAIAREVFERARAPRVVHTARSRWLDWRLAASIVILAIGAGSFVVMRNRGDNAPEHVAPVAVRSPVPEAKGNVATAPESVATISPTVATPSAELSAASDVSDLSDNQLRALVDDLQTLDALPSPDPEPVTVRVGLPGSESIE